MKELKIFFTILSEIPKQIWVATSRLPYKTAKEILYFNQAFSGLMKFEAFQTEVYQMKYQLKNHKDRISKALKDMIDSYLAPLYEHIQNQEK